MTNLVPIESFRREMMLHPWYFFQLDTVGSTFTDCDQLTREYGYQTADAAGRADVRRALETAERILQDHLGYSIAPHFVTQERQVPRWYDIRLNRNSYIGADGRWLSLQLPEGKIRNVGVETRTSIGTVAVAPGSGLVYTDADGDGVLDTFTATIATTVTDPTEIEVIFAAADRLDGAAASEDYRIAPVQVSISGGTATIKGRYWLLVKPIKYQAPGFSSALDIGTASNFVTSLEIYRRFCDATGTTTDTAQARLIWETRPWPWFIGGCCGGVIGNPNALDPAAVAYAIARIGLRDAEHGIVSFGESTYDTANAQWVPVLMSNCRPPDRIDVRYEAGADYVGGYIDPEWVTTVCRLAAAEMGRRVCACSTAGKEMYYWQVDRAFSGSAELEKFSVSPDDMDNPIGTRNGHLYAWKKIKALRQLRGTLA